MTPPGTVAQLHGVGERETAVVLFWGYMLCGGTMMIYMVACFAILF